jgi:DNA-binding MarR family transcriptional regulator
MGASSAVKIAPDSASEDADPLEFASGRNSSSTTSTCAGADPLERERRTIPDREIGDASEKLNDCELRAWRGLLRAHASLAKLLDAALEREHGLPLTSYEVLSHLDGAEQGRMRMCDLAEQAQMSRSGLTRLVDRLERERLLERCSCEHDARGAYACLTSAGRERLGAARCTHLQVVREHFLSRFSAEELTALAGLWDRVTPCGCSG